MQKLQAGRAKQTLSVSASDPIGRSFSWLPSELDINRMEERRELLKKTLRQLPKQQHETLMLAVWEGLDGEAIALKLGEPNAKVQSSLRAGMRFVRHRMRVILGKWSAPI